MENSGNKIDFKKIDAWLLPRNLDKQSMPYVWLVYLPFFFIPAFYYAEQLNHWLYTAAASLLFLFIYFRIYWVSSKQVLIYIILLACLATFCSLYTVSALTFFIYAAAFCCRLPTQKCAFITLFTLILWMIVLSITFSLSANFYLPGVVFSLIIGLVNIYQVALQEKNQALVLSQEETKRLAKVAERERIARDLHDLIGHTFSVITLKADLAGRLLNKGMTQSSSIETEQEINKSFEKAQIEIKQLEEISRDALSQVREVVSGYRSSDLLSELANAKYVLASVDIDFSYQVKNISTEELALDLHVIKELAIVLRELVTNIIKHAQATKVTALIDKQHEELVLTVQDNGKGFEQTPKTGFGLKGIEERIQQLAGNVTINSETAIKENQGTNITIVVPFSINN